MAITRGSGTTTDPYILTCWKDLYLISSYRNNYFKFIDNYFEDLSETYTSGEVPEVNLVNVNYGVTAASEIDFNGATFINGRLNGFKIKTFTSGDISSITINLKNLNMFNCIDTGTHGGFIHGSEPYDTDSTVYMVLSLHRCNLEIEGENRKSILIHKNKRHLASAPGLSMDCCKITLKGMETLGESIIMNDCIINYDNVLLDSTTQMNYTSDGSVHSKTVAAPIFPDNNITLSGNKVNVPFVKNSIFTGSVRTNGDAETALFFYAYDNVIIDVKCDNIVFRNANAAIAVSKATNILKIENHATIAENSIHIATPEDITNREKLYEWGFSIRPVV